MKSLITLWKQLSLDLGSWCGTSTTRDLETVTRRSNYEGMSFLTITLPSFLKEFEYSLEKGQVAPTSFSGFAKRGGLPKFLQGFLEQVFELGTGRLLNNPSVDCIKSIRQLTGVFAKIDLPCSIERQVSAYDAFVQCEQDVRDFDNTTPLSKRMDFVRVASLLFRDVLLSCDSSLWKEEAIPKHGPGATADRLYGNQKYRQVEWPARLQKVFPWEDFLAPSPRFVEELADEIDILEPGRERPVKVITVPKTMKTPRIIAIEPTCMQYAQQALSEMLVDRITKSNYLGGMIGFDDQPVNHWLAQVGSFKRSHATLDLSEASDRVSLQHVKLLLSGNPLTQEAVLACRSSHADVPGHGIIPLAKFASMGSALTFPIEALVFLTIVFLGIEESINRPLTRFDIRQIRSGVRVYGDDIIVPVEYVSCVIRNLETFGLKVNGHKSFWNGKFRESCGKEYYDGQDVSIVKVRRDLPSSRRDAQQVISMVAFRNLAYEHGYWTTCRWLDDYIRDVLPYFPDVLPTSPALGRLTFLGYQSEKFDPDLHRPLVKAYVQSATSPINEIDGVPALMKVFLKRGEVPFNDEEHLVRSGRPKSVRIKTRWVPPY